MSTPVPPTARSKGAVRLLAVAWQAAPMHVTGYLSLTVAFGAVPVAIAWLTKLVIDQLVDPGFADRAWLGWLVAGLVAATVVIGVLRPVQAYLMQELSRRVGRTARYRLFAALDRQRGLARFEDPVFRDRLLLAQQAGQTSPTEVLGSAIGVLQGAVTLIGFLGSLLAVSPVMALVVLLAGIPALLAELALSRRRAAMMLRLGHAERRDLFYSNLLTELDAAKEIRLFRLGEFFRGRMLHELRHIDANHRALDRREMRAQAGLALLSTLIAGVGLAWAVFAAAGGRLSVGDVSLFIGAVAGVQNALSLLVGGIGSLHHALLLFANWIDVTDAEPDLPIPARPQPVRRLRRGIELRDVWFRYGEDHPWVLKGVDLVIPHGSALALVGRNGSGKSTLVKLLCRLYDPTRGAVLWDGVDLRELDVDQLRDRIATVFQDYMAYDLTAQENVGLGDLAALHNQERIAAAAAAAGVDEVINALPSGYRTQLTRLFLGEADSVGVLLSGGQWQRVALARALLRPDPDLLILDEPNAGLDAEAEHEIHQRLRATRTGRTSLLVSHRLGALRDADSVVVLEDGRVAEQGTHSELIDGRGTYARLFTLQAAGYQEPDLVPVPP